jgi:Mycothiol maleylpyruvate isomerase N-terminal domain
MDVVGMLDREDEGWRRLQALFARVPADRFEMPGVTAEGWSPKDLMFHVGAWLAECGRILDQIRDGTYRSDEFDEPGKTDRMNAAWWERSKEMDASEVRALFESARVRARDAFGMLGEITPDAWEWFEESGPLHYDEHGKALEAWLGR